MKTTVVKYFLVAGIFSFSSLYAGLAEASYYRIEEMKIQSGGPKERVLCILDRDGNLLEWMELNDHREKNFTPFSSTGIKPRPTKAIIRKDNELGCVVGFFDKWDLLIGTWCSYDGSLDLRPDESAKFPNFDVNNLRCIIDQTSEDPS